MKYYGMPPKIVMPFIELHPTEMCFVQYMPIAMAESEGLGLEIRIPKNLQWVTPLIDSIKEEILGQYVYLTVKHLYVTPNNMGNRPGWHSDGFGTPDLNYIWTDMFPTEFCVQNFNISKDCTLSMKEMAEQVKEENIITYGCKAFLKLDEFNIHRSPIGQDGYRTFVKISISKEKYNLEGNAHNYLFDYEWKMQQRNKERNHPHK